MNPAFEKSAQPSGQAGTASTGWSYPTAWNKNARFGDQTESIQKGAGLCSLLVKAERSFHKLLLHFTRLCIIPSFLAAKAALRLPWPALPREEEKETFLCICSHYCLLFPAQLEDQNFFLYVFRHGKVSIYLNIFLRFNTQVQPYLSKEFTDDIYKSSVITAGLKNEFCELRYIIVFLFSFFLMLQRTMCLSFPAVLLRYLQLKAARIH